MPKREIVKRWEKFREPKRPIEARKVAGNPNDAVSWSELSDILGPPPKPPAANGDYANGWNTESNPNSRAKAEEDRLKFIAVAGRKPTKKELGMIEQRWLGWGYE